MNQQQKTSAAKFLYDVTKGVLLVTVAGNLMQKQINIYTLMVGFFASVVFYTAAYQFEK